MVSIIIPNYNKSAFIRETLNSLLNQTNEDWEAIIVDDGSTDDSIAICEEFLTLDKRISLKIRERLPKGGSTCRNIGLELAKGDFVVFVDSDDLLAKNCIESRLNKILNTNYDFTVFPIRIFQFKINDSTIEWKIKEGDHLAQFLKHDLPWHTMSCIWRKSFLTKLDGFNENFPRLQDVELHTRALLEDNVKYKIESNLTEDCYYRIGLDKIITDYEEYIDNWAKGTECYLNFFEDYLKIKNKSNFIRYLKVTLLVMVSQLNLQYQNDHISERSLQSYYLRLINCSFSKNQLKPIDLKIIGMYNRGYRVKLNKIKGFNYIFRKLILLT